MNRTSSLTFSQMAQDLEVRDPDAPQDWGIVNGEADRLSEFTAYYVHHAVRFEDWRVEHDLGELLLQSANGALLEGANGRVGVEATVEAVVSRRTTEPTRFLLNYWARLGLGQEAGEAGEWPIGPLLRQALGGHSTSGEGGQDDVEP